MASSGSWPNPDVLSQCFTVVRWFHEQGSTWSGTSSELASKLSSYCDTGRWFSNSDQLVSFLETNVVMLRELGVEPSITRFIGRPSVIDLRSSAADASNQPKVSTEATEQSPIAEPVTLAPRTFEAVAQNPAPQNEVPQAVVADDPVAASENPNLNKPADRLYSLLGVPEIEIMLDGFNPEAKDEPASGPAPVTARKKTVPLVFVAVILVALTLTAFIFVRSQSTKSVPPAAPTNTTTLPTAPSAAPAVETTPALDPAESDEFNKLLQQAISTKDAIAQYELALRYSEGRGVKQDNAAAYSWLTLARKNGSLASDSAIQTLTAHLSPSELQKARITIGNSFMNGVGVQRNYVQAHHWLALAELSGSSEAGALKKQLETKMPLWQIQQATAQNATH
jgi:hypothetical protein